MLRDGTVEGLPRGPTSNSEIEGGVGEFCGREICFSVITTSGIEGKWDKVLATNVQNATILPGVLANEQWEGHVGFISSELSVGCIVARSGRMDRGGTGEASIFPKVGLREPAKQPGESVV